MKIKKVEAATEQLAMEKIKEDLGPDAIVLSIKPKRSGGFFGFFQKMSFEVTAAYDERSAYASKTSREPAKIPNLLRARVENGASTIDLSVGDSTETPVENATAAATAVERSDEIFNKNKRIIQLEEVVRGLQKRIKENEEVILKMEQQLSEVEAAPKEYMNSIIQLIYETMMEQGVLPEVADKMLTDAIPVVGDDGDDIELVTKIVYNAIIKALGEPCPIEASVDKSSNTAFLLGPTGVGKTTTIAKLTSSFIFSNNFEVGLITADTYRIAAVEQLKIYGEILGIEVDVVYKSDDLRISLEKLRKKSDIILIDTAGRSHHYSEHVDELKDMLDAAPDSRKFLVLSAATKYDDMVDTVNIYSSIITDFGIIFSKLDETLTLGSILNICYTTGKSVAYVTYGQNVPDDIEIIQPDKVAKSLLGVGGDLY